MKKQVIGFLIVLAALILSTQIVPIGVQAVDHNPHCICGDKSSGVGDHSCAQVSWQPLTVNQTGTPLPTGNYYLSEDITLNSSITFAKNSRVNICLNGHSLTGNPEINGEDGRVFNMAEVGVQLSICDCSAENTGSITSTANAAGSVALLQNSAQTLNVFGGTLNGATTTGAKAGATIRQKSGLEDSIFNLYGGIIQGGNSGSFGGNVAIYGTMNMYGGIIQNGSAVKKGGNVYIHRAFNMYGGTIQGGYDPICAGVYIRSSGSFQEYGGNITDAVYAQDLLQLRSDMDLNRIDRSICAQEQDIRIDLNGYRLSGGSIDACGYRLFCMDSAAADPSAQRQGSLASSILGTDGPQPAFAPANGSCYIAIQESNAEYTFLHASIGIDVTQISKSKDGVSVTYQISTKLDDLTLSYFPENTSLGFQIWLREGNKVPGIERNLAYFQNGKALTARISNIMAADSNCNAARAMAKISIQTFLNMNGTAYEVLTYDLSLQEIFEQLDPDFKELDSAFQSALTEIYREYPADMRNWRIPNIMAASQFTEPQISDAEEAALRQQVLEYMQKMQTLHWTPAQSATLTCGCSGMHGGSKALIPGKTYVGIPYSHSACSYEKFMAHMTNGVLNLGNTDIIELGNDCADSIYWAFSQISSGVTFTLTGNSQCYNGTYPVGDYSVRGQNGTEEYNTTHICSENGPQKMYEAYAQIQLGDALVWGNPHGHMILASADAYVVYQNGQIDPTASCILIYEQGSSTSTNGFGKFTFEQLFKKHYIPITILAYRYGADTEQVFACAEEDFYKLSEGYLVSNYRINYVTLQVVSTDNTIAFEQTQFHGKISTQQQSNWFSLSKLESAIATAQLTSGADYTCRLSVHVGDADLDCMEFHFTAQ